MSFLQQVKSIFASRELLQNLVVKELKVRYRNSILGFFWSLLNPLLVMIIFNVIFGQVFRLGIKNFPIYLLSGLLAWNFFNLSVSGATGSVVGNSALVKKVSFPREILPLSVVLANLVNFLLELIVLFGFLIYYRVPFFLYIPALAVIVILQTVFVSGLALMLSAANTYFRDIQYIVSVLVMTLFYLTPIIYNTEMIEKMSITKTYPIILIIYKANPITAFTEMYHSVLYGAQMPGLDYFLYALVGSLISLFFGAWVFRRLKPAFAELV